MTDISAHTLIDREVIAAAQARLDDAKAKLENAKAAAKSAEVDVSRAWDASVAQIAAGGDAMAGHAAHAEAVQRRDFAVKLVSEFERNLAVEQESFRVEHIRAHEPVLRKGRELRLAAAKAHDDAKRIADDANTLAQQGNQLIAAAHGAGLRHFHLNELGRTAQSLKNEEFFWQTETEGAKAFWGRSVSE